MCSSWRWRAEHRQLILAGRGARQRPSAHHANYDLASARTLRPCVQGRAISPMPSVVPVVTAGRSHPCHSRAGRRTLYGRSTRARGTLTAHHGRARSAAASAGTSTSARTLRQSCACGACDQCGGKQQCSYLHVATLRCCPAPTLPKQRGSKLMDESWKARRPVKAAESLRLRYGGPSSRNPG